MAEARSLSEWDRTATIVAMIAETIRDHSKRTSPFTPAEFHPLRRKTDDDVIRVDLRDLKPMFKQMWG